MAKTSMISKKGIILIIIPLFAIFLQIFIRFVLDKDFNTIGITLGALGLGQIIPFLYFDHFVANKILGMAPEYKTANGKFTVSYELKNNIPNEEIEKIKNLFYIAIFFSLALFMCTVYCGINDQIVLHSVFGGINCVISWYLLVFK